MTGVLGPLLNFIVSQPVDDIQIEEARLEDVVMKYYRGTLHERSSSLLLHSLRRARTLVLAMGALLGAFQVVLILVARSIQRTGGFDQLVNLLPPSPGR